ncbi:uncharacterized protein LOC119769330 [Culex quinquefasciatus]|uniref:uncharacterized protein LOC119769330 n=1 Tax=Culex quinquefasciatus TaxID=7176 RepID=UPI0018E2C626|nr:uncharacterized protein LOC119769330 [Culex quinquefasciatus]
MLMNENDPEVDEVRNFIVANHPAVAKIRMITNDPGVEEVRIFFVSNLPSVAEMLMNENDPGVDEVRILVVANLPAVAKLLMIGKKSFFSITRISATEGRLATERMCTLSTTGSFLIIPIEHLNSNLVRFSPINAGSSISCDIQNFLFLGHETFDREEDWPQGGTTPGLFRSSAPRPRMEGWPGRRCSPRPHSGCSRSYRPQPSIHRMLLEEFGTLLDSVVARKILRCVENLACLHGRTTLLRINHKFSAQ